MPLTYTSVPLTARALDRLSLHRRTSQGNLGQPRHWRSTCGSRSLAFLAWKAGQPVEGKQAWRDLILATRARGVVVRRARVVSEPVTDYVRYEHGLTASHNVAAGELVRWLPRRWTSDLCLPGNDFWLLDSKTVMFNHFTGDGESVGREVTDDPAVAKMCSAAFEAVWVRAIDHSQYRLD